MARRAACSWLPQSQRIDFDIVGRTLMTMIKTQVFTMSIVIVFEVRRVMAMVVTDQVA